MTTDLIKKLEASGELWPSLLVAKQKIRDCFERREPVVAILKAKEASHD